MKCLVLPIRPRTLRRRDWWPLIDKIEKKLDGWKGTFYSLGGSHYFTLLSLLRHSTSCHTLRCLSEWRSKLTTLDRTSYGVGATIE